MDKKLVNVNDELKKQLIIARSSLSVEMAEKMYNEIGYGSGGVVGQKRIQKFIEENTEDNNHSFISKKEVEELKGKIIKKFETLLSSYEDC